jgi:outer membrane cobalamin receptor
LKHAFIVLCSALLFPTTVAAQEVTDSLPVVELYATHPDQSATSTFAVQQLDKARLERLNAMNVAEASKFFSGVLVKDYGGLGGLKTISVRSLGANHTAVMYDGIVMNDVQNGQTDLGKLTLSNVEKLSLFQGQPASVLMPARAMASASVLMIQTADHKPEQGLETQAAIKAGSFGFFNPSASFTLSGKKVVHKLSGEWLTSKGDYTYPSLTDDEKIKRTNTEMESTRMEYDVFIYPNDSLPVHLKAYYYSADRQLPGAVILYNPFADDYLKDKHFILQGSWKTTVSSKTALWLNARYQYVYNGYTDPTYNNNAGYIENFYHQRELYVSASASHHVKGNWYVGGASDFFAGHLKRTDDFIAGFVPVSRRTWLNTLQAKWSSASLQVQAGGVATLQWDYQQGVSGSKEITSLDPFIALNWQTFQGKPFRIRASYKETFRAPSFNDLYYTMVGNTGLHPEKAVLYNLGFTTLLHPKGMVESITLTADAYYNRVSNKIQAIPRQNIFQWSMVNIGKADIRGVDVVALINIKPNPNWYVRITGAYTFQKALDMSNASSTVYKKQLPYMPVHSGNAGWVIEYKRIAFSYNLLFSGYRYRQGEQIKENFLNGWLTQDAKIMYVLKPVRKAQIHTFLEVNNLFSEDYEVVKLFPMPGIHYRLGVNVKFKSK